MFYCKCLLFSWPTMMLIEHIFFGCFSDELPADGNLSSASVQTDVTSAHLGQMFDELQALRTDINLKTRLDKSPFSMAGFQGNDT